MPTATIQMKNIAIDRTSEIFSADQVSMCRNCRRARRGPRPAALPGVRPRVAVTTGVSPICAVEEPVVAPVTGPAPVVGTGGAPGGPPAGLAAGDAPVA